MGGGDYGNFTMRLPTVAGHFIEEVEGKIGGTEMGDKEVGGGYIWLCIKNIWKGLK